MHHPSSSPAPHAEAEIKIALGADDCRALPARLAAAGFPPGETEALTDYYLDFARAPLGGWNFLRLRAVNDATYLRTDKRWVSDADGHAVRLEEEHALTAEAFHRQVARADHPRTLHKTRRNFHGYLAELPVTVSLDVLTLRDRTYCFLEAEALVPVAQAQVTRERLRAWVRDTLGLPADTEAISMLELLLSVEEQPTEE